MPSTEDFDIQIELSNFRYIYIHTRDKKINLKTPLRPAVRFWGGTNYSKKRVVCLQNGTVVQPYKAPHFHIQDTYWHLSCVNRTRRKKSSSRCMVSIVFLPSIQQCWVQDIYRLRTKSLDIYQNNPTCFFPPCIPCCATPPFVFHADGAGRKRRCHHKISKPYVSGSFFVFLIPQASPEYILKAAVCQLEQYNRFIEGSRLVHSRVESAIPQQAKRF